MERTLILPAKQQGFALVASVFLIVVLGLAGIFMVRFSGTVQSGQTQLLMAQRAKQAANAAIEYGVYQVVNGTCAASTLLSVAAYSQFDATVTCDAKSYFAGITLYTIQGTASYGTMGEPDYVWRQYQVVVEQ